MPTDDCIRLDDRQRIANFRKQPIEANEYHSVDGAEGEFLWSSSPKNVDLLPQRPNLCLKHYPRPDQIDNHPTNEPAKILIAHDHRPILDRLPSGIRFATGTSRQTVVRVRVGSPLDPEHCEHANPH